MFFNGPTKDLRSSTVPELRRSFAALWMTRLLVFLNAVLLRPGRSEDPCGFFELVAVDLRPSSAD